MDEIQCYIFSGLFIGSIVVVYLFISSKKNLSLEYKERY